MDQNRETKRTTVAWKKKATKRTLETCDLQIRGKKKKIRHSGEQRGAEAEKNDNEIEP